MAADLDQVVEEFRHRPLDAAGPFTFLAADALTMKVREGGRVVNAVGLVATDVNGDGHREVLDLRVVTSPMIRVIWLTKVGPLDAELLNVKFDEAVMHRDPEWL